MDSSAKSEDEPCAADGSWDRLDLLELRACAKVSEQIEAFASAFRDAYEAGVIIPVLRVPEFRGVDVRAAALFHKRALNDLRGVWILLRMGYTSQAASVAASLYESALAVSCLLQSDENVKALMTDPHLEVPWSITEMAKMVVCAEGKDPKSSDHEQQWQALYAHYVWLCQIKHSSSQSVLHDASGTMLEKGYVVMALPNVTEADISVKAMVAVISLHRICDCTERFARSLGHVGELPTRFRFSERFQRARDSAWKAFEPHLKSMNAIGIQQSRFMMKQQQKKKIHE